MIRDTVLSLWHNRLTADEISDTTGLHRDTVFKYIRQARFYGDPRAARRTCQAPARKRATKIKLLASIGLATRHIAGMVGVSQRAVQIVLREVSQ